MFELTGAEINILDNLRDGDEMRLVVEEDPLIEEAIINLLTIGYIRVIKPKRGTNESAFSDRSETTLTITYSGKKCLDTVL